MNRITLKDARPELARLAGVTGFNALDSRFLARLNRAIEELMNAGDWPGVVDRYRFRNFDGLITLPAEFQRIVGVAIDNVPMEMRSPWFEFVQDGPGQQDSTGWVDLVLDRGDVCTFQPIPDDGTEYTLRVVGEVDERESGERPAIIVRGYDADGEPVRTDIDGARSDGEAVAINGDTVPKQTDSVTAFSEVTAVIKPETRGNVDLYATNGTDTIHIARYSPREKTPSYRQYFVPGIASEAGHTVLVRARRRFIPVRDDNDFLLISNMGALESMLMALQKREAEDLINYMGLRKVAIGLLADEAKRYLGASRKPVITFARDFGIGSIPHVQ